VNLLTGNGLQAIDDRAAKLREFLEGASKRTNSHRTIRRSPSHLGSRPIGGIGVGHVSHETSVASGGALTPMCREKRDANIDWWRISDLLTAEMHSRSLIRRWMQSR
jgi:hypothetical protein